MATFTVNGKTLEAKDGDNLLDVLRKNNIHVPALCHMSGLFPTGACRMCVVEVDGQRGLVPSCSCAVNDGMNVNTHTKRVLKARKTIVELLLSNHPDDCLYCDRNKNCELQDLATDYNITERRFVGERNQTNLDISSPSLVRDPDKCILCGRCVRMCTYTGCPTGGHNHCRVSRSVKSVGFSLDLDQGWTRWCHAPRTEVVDYVCRFDG